MSHGGIASPLVYYPPGSGTRVSWAQNAEDVRLWRAFDGMAHGHYVEVGGCHPADDSVTRSLYERGWSGVVVEPVPELAEVFAAERPRDIVVAKAAGAEPGEAEITVFPGTGLSTLVPEIAERHVRSDFAGEVRRVEVEPLSSILERLGFDSVHVLVVDVEGFEPEVLAGAGLASLRPWVLVIEATEPLSGNPTWGVWEPLVLDVGYRLVAEDGINRFYVSPDHLELGPFVATPPNVLDDYISIRQVQAAEEHGRVVRALGAAQERCAELAEALADASEVIVRQREDLSRALDSAQEALAEGERCSDLTARVRALETERDALLGERGLLDALLDRARSARDEVERSLASAETAVWQARNERDQAASVLDGVVHSRSWRLTAPLRSRAAVLRRREVTDSSGPPHSDPDAHVPLEARRWARVLRGGR